MFMCGVCGGINSVVDQDLNSVADQEMNSVADQEINSVVLQLLQLLEYTRLSYSNYWNTTAWCIPRFPAPPTLLAGEMQLHSAKPLPDEMPKQMHQLDQKPLQMT